MSETGSEPAVSETGSEPAVSETGSEPAVSETGSRRFCFQASRWGGGVAGHAVRVQFLQQTAQQWGRHARSVVCLSVCLSHLSVVVAPSSRQQWGRHAR